MKKKFNFIDICIVLFVVLAVVFAVKYFSVGGTKQNSGAKQDIYYTVEVKSMPYDIKDHIKEGDSVRNSMKGYELGVVSKVDIRKNVEIREDMLDGKFIETSFPDRCDAYITIKATPEISDNGTASINSEEIKIGKMMYIRSKKYAFSGFVVEMNLCEPGK